MKEMVDLEFPGDSFSCLDRFYLFFGAKIDKDTKRLFLKRGYLQSKVNVIL